VPLVATNKRSETPLVCFVQSLPEKCTGSQNREKAETVQLLLELGADETVEWIDTMGFPALYHAVNANSVEVSRLLLQAGAKLSSLPERPKASLSPQMQELLQEYSQGMHETSYRVYTAKPRLLSPKLSAAKTPNKGFQRLQSPVEVEWKTPLSECMSPPLASLTPFVSSVNMCIMQTPAGEAITTSDLVSEAHTTAAQGFPGEAAARVVLEKLYRIVLEGSARPWQLLFDEATQCQYFFNEITGASSWEPTAELIETLTVANPKLTSAGAPRNLVAPLSMAANDEYAGTPSDPSDDTYSLAAARDATNPSAEVSLWRDGARCTSSGARTFVDGATVSPVITPPEEINASHDAVASNNAEACITSIRSAIVPVADVDVEKAVVSAHPTASTASAPTGVDKEAIEKYSKMRKMGVPWPAILHKMTVEGLSPAVIDAVKADKEAVKDAVAPVTSTPATAPEASGADKEAIEKYSKMSKMGVPWPAILHKMTVEGLSPAVINAVKADKEAVKDAVAPVTSTPATAPEASGADKEAIEKYSKMSKMGVPWPAILHKMTVEGLSPAVIDAVKADKEAVKDAVAPVTSTPATAPEASGADKEAIEKYSKMSKMGVPWPAILHKMTVEGLSPAVINAVKADKEAVKDAVAPVTSTPATAPEASGADKEAIEKYSKMSKMGVPWPAILHKMTVDGVAASAIQAVKLAAGGTTNTEQPATENAPPAVSASAAAQLKQEAMDMVQSDPKFAKYTNMRKLGIPLGAIKEKMGMDNVDKEDMQTFLTANVNASSLEAMGLLSPRKGSEAPATASAAVCTTVAANPPAIATLKLHWDPLKLSEDKLRNTIWGKMSEQRAAETADGDSHLQSADIALLTSLFAAKKPVAAVAADTATKKHEEVALKTLLEMKRANNLNIALAQFKRLPKHADIPTAVYRLDAVTLPRDLLDKLALVMPTVDEQKTLRAFKGNPATLMECDRFFLTIMSVPRFPIKVASFIAFLSLEEICNDIRARISVLQEASSLLLHSERLQSLLGHVLTIGNTLNQGHSHLTASAISLDSLAKLAATKSADRKTSLMDALAIVVIRKTGDSITTLKEELHGVGAAKRIEISDIRNEFKQLCNALEAAAKEIETEKAEITTDSDPTKLDTRRSTSIAPPLQPAPVNAGDARSSMLAQMMAKRAPAAGAEGQGQALPGSAAAPIVAKLGKPEKPANPCSLDDRRKFCSDMGAFVTKSRTTLASLQSELDALDALIRSTVLYFGEDPASTSFSKVAAALQEFVNFFHASAVTQIRKTLAESRSTLSTSKA
jgi:hypothetical protein